MKKKKAKTLCKKSISLLLALLLVLSIFSSFGIASYAQEITEKAITVNEIDGTGLSVSKPNGMPDGAYYIQQVFHNISDEYAVAISGRDNERQEGFLAVSKNGKDYTVCYPESVFLGQLPDKYSSYFWDEYGDTFKCNNGWYYFECSGKLKDTYSWEIFYLKTKDFKSWAYSETDSSGIVLPQGKNSYSDVELLGEYNGTYIAADIWEDTEQTEDNKVLLTYYISNDGKSWTEKNTPYISASKETTINGSSAYGSIKVSITEAGVLFYTDTYGDLYVAMFDVKHSEYYLTTDFANYQKLDLTALGGCKGKIYPDKKTAEYDSLELKTTFVGDEIIFYRMYGKLEENENAYSADDALTVLSNTTEVYTLDKKTMKLVKTEEYSDMKNISYAFLTENQYVFMSYNIDGTNSVYVKDGGSLTKYSDNGLGLNNMSFFYHITDKNYSDMLKPDGTADVEYLIGITNNKIIVSYDLFQSVYAVSLPADDGVRWSFVSWLVNDDLCVNRYNESTYTTEYFIIDKEELFNYIKANMPIIPGDISGDGKINAVDARWVLQAASGAREFDATQAAAADVNGDGKINAVDARWILQVASGARVL